MQFFGIPSVNLYCYLMSQTWLLHLLCEINGKLWENCCSVVVLLEINIHIGWFNISNIFGEMVGEEDLDLHCSHVGPHLGTRVPMGTFFSFWVPKRSPFSFQGPHFPYFRLKNALKVTAAIVY